MFKKIALVGAAAALAFTTIGVGAASAGTPPINGTGKVGTCPTTGQIKIKPPLVGFPVTDTTPPGTVAVKTKPPTGFVGPCPGATGDGLNVLSAKSKGGESTPHSSCSGLAGTATNVLTLTVKWKTATGTPKLNPSTLTITSETGGITGDGHGSFDVSGTVTAGSFNGDAVSGHVETDQTITDIVAACNAKGLQKNTFGLNGLSTTTIG